MEPEKEKLKQRLYGLLKLQKEIESQFGEDEYNVFIFGSYISTSYREGVSDIDIAVFTENFDLYKQLSMYLEEYFESMGIDSDIFYIDLTVEAPVYCAPLSSKVQFTDYYPQKLIDFKERCQNHLNETKVRIAG